MSGTASRAFIWSIADLRAVSREIMDLLAEVT